MNLLRKLNNLPSESLFPRSPEDELHHLERCKDIDSRRQVWRILKEKIPSLLTLEPSALDTPHIWALAHTATQNEKDYILQNLPTHKIWESPPFFYEHSQLTRETSNEN